MCIAVVVLCVSYHQVGLLFKSVWSEQTTCAALALCAPKAICLLFGVYVIIVDAVAHMAKVLLRLAFAWWYDHCTADLPRRPCTCTFAHMTPPQVTNSEQHEQIVTLLHQRFVCCLITNTSTS